MRLARYYWLFVLAGVLHTGALKAQKDNPFDLLLLSAESDPTLVALHEQIDYLNSRPYKLSAIQRLEVRSSLNQLDQQRQGYALRTQFSNPWEIRNNNRYFEKLNQNIEAERTITLRNLLYDRYKAGLSAILANELHHLLLQHDSLTKRLLHANHTSRLSTEFSSNAYIDALHTNANELIRSTELYLEHAAAAKIIHELSGSYEAENWNSDLLLTVNELKSRLPVLIENAMAESSVLAYEVSLLDVTQSALLLKKSSINPGFVQARYEPYRTDQQRLPWTISIGIALPLSNPNKASMARQHLEIIDQRNKILLTQQRQTGLCKLYQDQLDLLIQQYETLTVQIQELQNPQLRNLLLHSTANNPWSVIQLDQKIVGLQFQELKLRFKVYELYLSYLKEADLLQHRPIINYLSPQK